LRVTSRGLGDVYKRQIHGPISSSVSLLNPKVLKLILNG
jgi:hypothetical protein